MIEINGIKYRTKEEELKYIEEKLTKYIEEKLMCILKSNSDYDTKVKNDAFNNKEVR